MPKRITLLARLRSILGRIYCPAGRKLTSAEAAQEKIAVQAAVAGFWRAYERKDLSTMTGLLSKSKDFIFFGTNSSEVITNVARWEALMKSDWALFESTRFEEPRNLGIQLSADGKLASIVYEALDASVEGGKEINSLDRFALTLRKEDGEWRIIQGMTAVATF